MGNAIADFLSLDSRNGGTSPVCRGWSTGTDEADQEGQEMKEKITELLQDLAAGASIFIFLFFLYILMAAAG